MRGVEGLAKMWSGWQNMPARETDCSVSKITFHNFPSPVLLQITVRTKDKGRGRDGTSECAQPKPLRLLVLCWGWGKGASSTICHSSEAASPKSVLFQSCNREGTETLAVPLVRILITYSKSMLFYNQQPFLAFFLEIAFPKTFKKLKKNN